MSEHTHLFDFDAQYRYVCSCGATLNAAVAQPEPPQPAEHPLDWMQREAKAIHEAWVRLEAARERGGAIGYPPYPGGEEPDGWFEFVQGYKAGARVQPAEEPGTGWALIQHQREHETDQCWCPCFGFWKRYRTQIAAQPAEEREPYPDRLPRTGWSAVHNEPATFAQPAERADAAGADVEAIRERWTDPDLTGITVGPGGNPLAWARHERTWAQAQRDIPVLLAALAAERQRAKQAEQERDSYRRVYIGTVLSDPATPAPAAPACAQHGAVLDTDPDGTTRCSACGQPSDGREG